MWITFPYFWMSGNTPVIEGWFSER